MRQLDFAPPPLQNKITGQGFLEGAHIAHCSTPRSTYVEILSRIIGLAQTLKVSAGAFLFNAADVMTLRVCVENDSAQLLQHLLSSSHFCFG